jgi:bifunctional ADP-heptose synthase (sugar kinase/adenylyltransferase)
MSEPLLGRRRLAELVGAFPALRATVLGDFFLDKYLDVDPAHAATTLETGRTAHQVVAVRRSAGAAGTVVNNLASLGVGSLRAIGFRGDDGEGYELEAALRAIGCATSDLLVDAGRRTPTYMKPRDSGRPGLAGEHSRYDIKNRSPTPPALEGRILASLEAALAETDVLVVMDQVEEAGCGVLTFAIVAALPSLVAVRPRLVAWADSRRRIMDFRGLVLKMNQFELAGAHEPEPGSIVPDEIIAAGIPSMEARCGAPVFVTAGDRGVWVGGPPSRRVQALALDGPVDPTGAGDSFTAGAVLALAAGASRLEAALVGNLVASVTVRQLDTTGVARPEELYPALDLWLERYA